MRFLPIFAILLLPCSTARAAYADTLASNFRVPAIVDYSVQTPAPRGYKPVYISHYGRHGARFLSDAEEYLRVLDPLATADAEGNLTDSGKAFYDACRDYYDRYARDREGELTPIGWRQHQAIADAIFDNYRRVFRRHPDVTAKATFYQRCIVSMSSFCLELARRDPKMRFFTESNGRDYVRLLNETGSCEPLEPGWDYGQPAYLENHTDPAPVLARIFKDPGRIVNPREFAQFIYRLVSSTSCVDPSVDLVTGIMTPEEMLSYYKASALRFYERCGVKNRRVIPVVQGIIDDADADLSCKVPPVRLRFGHDIVSAAVLSLLDVDGFGTVPPSSDQAYRTMRSCRIPMACTILFVFYRKGDNVLVKILLDGRETSLPIPSVKGPYYDWNAFKDYFRAICEKSS